MSTEWLTADQPAWVQGVKRKTADSSPDFFHKHVCAVVTERFVDVPHAASSSATETSLEIPPSLYWYVGRADDLYGEVVFLCAAGTAPSDPTEEGFCPFDSGGMWSGKIQTSPSMAPESAERREIFRRYNRQLGNWQQVFLDHLGSHYDGRVGYVRGDPPSGMPHDFPVICKSPPNHAVAWTWEGRVSYTKADARVRARHAFLTRARKDALLNWAESQPWEIFTVVLPWIENNAETHPEPDVPLSPVEMASRLLEKT